MTSAASVVCARIVSGTCSWLLMRRESRARMPSRHPLDSSGGQRRAREHNSASLQAHEQHVIIGNGGGLPCAAKAESEPARLVQTGGRNCATPPVAALDRIRSTTGVAGAERGLRCAAKVKRKPRDFIRAGGKMSGKTPVARSTASAQQRASREPGADAEPAYTRQLHGVLSGDRVGVFDIATLDASGDTAQGGRPAPSPRILHHERHAFIERRLGPHCAAEAKRDAPRRSAMSPKTTGPATSSPQTASA